MALSPHTLKLEGLGNYPRLSSAQWHELSSVETTYKLTYQETHILLRSMIECAQWGKRNPVSLFNLSEPSKQEKKKVFNILQQEMLSYRREEKEYNNFSFDIKRPDAPKIVKAETKGPIFGMCPAQSEKTVCCNLRTLDAVQGCSFGCSYCTIQTFYRDEVKIEKNLEQKLNEIELEKDRRYHIGTGQASDSLLWSGRDDLMDPLLDFAVNNPNVLLEFKTKTGSISKVLSKKIPKNVVFTWSLNSETVALNEEHYTAGLDEKLDAAAEAAEKGVSLGFHFHPMVYYSGWEKEYQEVVKKLISRISPEQILFISFGTVTLIKPVYKEIMSKQLPTLITQMEMVDNPDGKLTYPDEVKHKLFPAIYKYFSPWHGKVFFYLCMEPENIWKATFGRSYETNEKFEKDFLDNAFNKINYSAKAQT